MFIQELRRAARELKGSLLIEARPYGSTGAFTSLGAGSGFKVNVSKNTGNVERDNIYPEVELSEEGIELSATLAEFLSANTLDVLFGTEGKSITVGTASTLTQSFIATTDIAYQINAVNANGAAPTVTSCKDSTGAAYAGYNLSKVGDKWMIDFGADDTYTVVFSYTPVASIRYEIGAASTLPYAEFRLTNKSENGTTIIYIYKGCNTQGIELDFQKDVGSADRAAKFSIKIKGFPDPNHIAANGNMLLGAMEGPFK